MSPALAEKTEEAAAVQKNTVDADSVTRTFYQLLDATFGASNWRPNTDPLYVGELGFHPVDVIALVDEHDDLYERAAQVESRMRRDFDVRVLIFVIEESNARTF